jgi:hypothetical protein
MINPMKSLPKLLGLAILGAAGILAVLLWQRPSAPDTLPRAGAALAPASVVGRAPFSDSQAAFTPAAESQDLLSAGTITVIHTNLQKWLDAKKHGSEEKEAEAMQALEALLTTQNSAQVARSLSRDELQTPFAMEAIRDWTKATPVEASNWMASQPGVTQDEAWAVAQGWVGDGQGLQNYAAQLPASPWKQALLQEAGARMSASDPTGAIELAGQMSPGAQQTALLQAVATNWGATDPNATAAWINRVDDPALRDQLIASAAQSYALSDPQGAAAWLASTVKSDATANTAALNIVQTWVTLDPPAAAKWVSQFPPGDTRTAAMDIVSRYWQQVDPETAAASLKKLSGGN